MYNSNKLKAVVRTYMDVSTAHITRNDDRLLTAGKEPILVDKLPYGYRVHIPTDEMNQSVTIWATGARACGYSEAFIDLIRAGYRLGCDFIILDGAAPVSDELPTFDW